MKQKELIPADPNQCQAEIPNGVTPFTMGGRFKMVRCANSPVIIATENKAGSDGLVGSMSLCSDCWKAAREQLGENYFSVRPI